MTPAHRVLVVEDDDTIRDTMVEFLQDNGYQAMGAVHGQDALDKLTVAPTPCLIVLDLMMPVMDGITFREQQLQNPVLSGIPVVIISAYQYVEARAQALDITAHLKKPLKLDDLLRTVRRYCEPTITGAH